MANQLAVHAPVTPGRAGPLRAAIAALPTGAASPLASLPATHYARLVVAEGVRDGAVFVFSAVTDLAHDAYLDAVLGQLGDLPDRLWSQCPGWPGAEAAVAARTWLQRHVVRLTLPFATWDAPLGRVQAGLALRARLVEFAPGAQDLTPEARHAAFREEFGR